VLQVGSDGVDPIKRGLIRFCSGIVGSLDKNEFVTGESDAVAAEIDRHCIEQFI